MTHSSPPGRGPVTGRALALFANFFLVILAYYQVKAASRSLLLDYGGPNAFPYVWIGSAFVLLAFIGVYNRLVARQPRVRIVVASLLVFSLILLGFRQWMTHGSMASVVLFYVFVDLFSVVIVEQFWSLANSVTRLDEGRRTYWFVASGGLAGGLAGGLVASALVAHTPLQTIDLLVSCAVLLVIAAVVNGAMGRAGLLQEAIDDATLSLSGAGLRAVTSNRYLLLIALVVCLSQLAEPVVEYQFLSAVNAAYAETDLRTQYIANFFSVLGFVSLGVNFLITPYVHRRLGVVAGLAVQPLMLGVVSSAFFAQQSATMASIMKIADRGLSYSINRASKELLYVPIDPVITFQAKAWIDMLGYRLFKVLGSSMIVFVTFNVPQLRVAVDLAWLTVGICTVWLVAVFWLGVEQRRTLVVVPA